MGSEWGLDLPPVALFVWSLHVNTSWDHTLRYPGRSSIFLCVSRQAGKHAETRRSFPFTPAAAAQGAELASDSRSIYSLPLFQPEEPFRCSSHVLAFKDAFPCQRQRIAGRAAPLWGNLTVVTQADGDKADPLCVCRDAALSLSDLSSAVTHITSTRSG